jgi:hypothetical protein
VSGVAAAATPLSGPAVVVLVCAGWVQALGMELFLFTLW